MVPRPQLSSKLLTTNYSPFLKWAGGKGRLLAQFVPLFPAKFNAYYEPFVGGGAVFFYLSNQYPGLVSKLSDSNTELVNCYQMVRDNPEQIIELLALKSNDEDLFYQERARDTASLDNLERAARLIFLNRTCFNGLYRVNSKGQFNVPFGKYKNPRIADHATIMAASEALQRASIVTSPFNVLPRRAVKGDFVYFDPPYQPVSKTANFTSYTKDSFTMDDQAMLAEFARKLKAKGVQVMLSNSDTPEIRKLYKDFDIQVVKAARAINCKGTGRGVVNELVIRSYR